MPDIAKLKLGAILLTRTVFERTETLVFPAGTFEGQDVDEAEIDTTITVTLHLGRLNLHVPVDLTEKWIRENPDEEPEYDSFRLSYLKKKSPKLQEIPAWLESATRLETYKYKVGTKTRYVHLFVNDDDDVLFLMLATTPFTLADVAALPDDGYIASMYPNDGFEFEGEPVQTKVAPPPPPPAGDTTPPVMTGLSVTNIKETSATVTWITDEDSTAEIDLGTSTAYTQTIKSLVQGKVHSIDIAGLTPNTTYHVRARSLDVAGNAATSGDQAFKTLAAPAITYDATYKLSFPGGGDATVYVLDDRVSRVDVSKGTLVVSELPLTNQRTETVTNPSDPNLGIHFMADIGRKGAVDGGWVELVYSQPGMLKLGAVNINTAGTSYMAQVRASGYDIDAEFMESGQRVPSRKLNKRTFGRRL